MVVTPDTVLRWQRPRFCEHWAKLSGRPTVGRPPVNAAIIALIRNPRSPSPPRPTLQRHRASYRCVDRSADRGHFPRRHRPCLSPPRSRRHLRGRLPPTCEGHAHPRSPRSSLSAKSVACIIDTSGEQHSHLDLSTSPSPPPRLFPRTDSFPVLVGSPNMAAASWLTRRRHAGSAVVLFDRLIDDGLPAQGPDGPQVARMEFRRSTGRASSLSAAWASAPIVPCGSGSPAILRSNLCRSPRAVRQTCGLSERRLPTQRSRSVIQSGMTTNLPAGARHTNARSPVAPQWVLATVSVWPQKGCHG